MRCPQCDEGIPRYVRSVARYPLVSAILMLVGGTIGYIAWMALNLLEAPFTVAFACGLLAGSGFVLAAGYVRRFRRIYCPRCKQDWDLKLKRSL